MAPLYVVIKLKATYITSIIQVFEDVFKMRSSKLNIGITSCNIVPEITNKYVANYSNIKSKLPRSY